MRRSLTNTEEPPAKPGKGDRRGRIWAVYDAKVLYFYSAYGEPRAKLSVPVGDVAAAPDLRTTDRSFNVHFHDKKVWNFEADTVVERKAWVHIINSNSNPPPAPPSPPPQPVTNTTRGPLSARSLGSARGYGDAHSELTTRSSALGGGTVLSAAS